MLKYWTPIPVKFSHLITDCTNEIQSQILMIFLLLLSLFFSFLADFLMWTRVAFPTTQFSAGCFRGRPLTDLLSSPHMLINNCLTSLRFLLQQWILMAACRAAQTTEIPLPVHHRNWKTICQGEALHKRLCLAGLRTVSLRTVDLTIPDDNLRNI